jgi:hypothetical protein
VSTELRLAGHGGRLLDRLGGRLPRRDRRWAGGRGLPPGGEVADRLVLSLDGLLCSWSAFDLLHPLLHRLELAHELIDGRLIDRPRHASLQSSGHDERHARRPKPSAPSRHRTSPLWSHGYRPPGHAAESPATSGGGYASRERRSAGGPRLVARRTMGPTGAVATRGSPDHDRRR